MNNIILKDGKCYQDSMNWEIGNQYAKIIEELNEDEILNLKLVFIVEKSKNENLLNRDLETIGDFWENLIEQTKENQKWISKKLGHNVDSFCVLRIGLFSLKYIKIK